MIIVNTPNNPGASVLSAADCAEFAALTRGTGIVIVSDEVYEHMVYDGLRHESLARYPELAARSVVIGSFGKTFHATGWKVGYALAPREITAEIRRVHQFTVFTVNSPMQHALAEFLREPARYEALPEFFAASAPAAFGAGGNAARALAVRGQLFPAGALRPRQRRAGAEFAQRLVREVGVATIPLSASTTTAPTIGSSASASPSATKRCSPRRSACGDLRA